MKHITICFLFLTIFSLNVYGAAQTGTDNAEFYFYDNKVITYEQLTTAADNTNKLFLVSSDGKIIFTRVVFQVVIAGITTNVIYRLEGSLDGDNWSAFDSNITKTANGTYFVNYVGEGQIRYIRLYWVSEAGGTAATLDIKAKVY